MEKEIVKNPIVDVGHFTIDLRKVTFVSKVMGDSSWRKYKITFIDGCFIEVYHDRKYFEDTSLNPMKREEFIKIWREYNSH